MKDKLELYREILEIEPNSKVFLAYAKLLEYNERIEEALNVLARGIERQPDYLEARLYYIDLLARSDKLESARLQLNRLTDIFQSHSSFWLIWSKLIAEDNPTISTTLGLLGTLFNDPSLSLLEILQSGIHAHTPKDYADSLKNSWQENKDVIPKVPTLAQVQANELAKADFSDAITVDSIPTESITITPEPQTEYFEEENKLQEDVFENKEEVLEEAFDVAKPAQRDYAHNHRFAHLQHNNYVDSSHSAKISTLTKSMADLLADQGDIVGAIKIYEHHLDIADEIEKPFIRSRLEYLYTLKNPNASQEQELHRPLSANISPRMQSMLSKLATRLENRA